MVENSDRLRMAAIISLFLEPMGTLEGKRIWITGASSGIGEALAHACRAQGAELILSARRMSELERVAAQLASDQKPTGITLQVLDVSDAASIPDIVSSVIAKTGSIDILINNAGISQRSYAAETSLEVDRRIMEVNFFGTIALTKAVLPDMLARNSGMIIVISSISGKFGFYLRSAYAASKHALHGFFESLRMEVWQQGVRVMMVCPGKIRTNISLNALKADGSTHRSMDDGQAGGRSARELADRILLGIRRNEEEVFFGGPEMKAVWIKRFFPRLFSKLIRKQKPE
jgi:dehydrogenase/reductase SDR family protein 7B